MKFQNTKVYNFQGGDSFFVFIPIDSYDYESNIADKWVDFSHPQLNWPQEYTEEGYNLEEQYCEKLIKDGVLRLNDNDEMAEVAYIGPNDMKLAQMLIKGGSEHRKFLRQIFVSVDITAPLYWY